MATIQLGTTGSASQLVNYAEKKATEKDGYNLDIDYAKSQMKQTRELFSKNDGIQAHHVIQSFKPDEITPEKANQVGLELAEKLAPEHEVAVYTHDDRNHIHNHIVINSVNFETGKKYQAHGQEAIEHARSLSDEVCQQHDLSVVKEFNAPVRHTLAEQHLLEKNEPSWKEQLREAIEDIRYNSTDFDNFKTQLNEHYGIETKLRGNTLSFKHPEREKFIRANKLGADYEKERLQNVIARQAEREQEHGRDVRGNEGIERTHDRIYSGSYERRNGERYNDSNATRTNTRNVEPSHERNAINFEQAGADLERKRRTFRKDFEDWTRRDDKNRQSSSSGDKRDGERERNEAKRDEQRNQQHDEQHQKRSERTSESSKERDEGLSR